MKLREIVELAAIMLQLEDVLNHPSIKDEQPFVLEGADNTSITINQLIRCADLVIKQMAAEYIPLEFSEQIEVANRRVEYSEFSKSVVDLLSITKNGEKVAFKIMPSFIAVNENGCLTFNYTFEPKRCGLDDELEYQGARVPARVFAYGLAAEWALISAMYDEAAIWDRRFKDSVSTLFNSRRSKRVRARKWI